MQQAQLAQGWSKLGPTLHGLLGLDDGIVAIVVLRLGLLVSLSENC